MLARANNAARCAFEMEPGEIARKSAHQRLRESQTHDEQARRNGVELWFDPRADHVGKRHGQCSAKHQIGHDAQRRQKNSEAKKEKRKREPFDAAEISGHVRLRRGIHRLKKPFAENAVINDRTINKPTESSRTVNLAPPLRCSSRPEENQMFEAKKRFGFTITFLLFQKRAESEAAMMPDDSGWAKRNDAARLLQAPAKIDVVPSFVVF